MAFIQAALLVVLALHEFAGLEAGYATDGDFVFGCIVLVANIKLLVSSYEIGAAILITIFGSILLYLTAYGILSFGIKIFDHFGTMQELSTHPYTYLAGLFFIFTFGWLDRAMSLFGDLNIKRQILTLVH